MQINKPKWDAWKMLPEAVRSGAVPFALAHGGLDMHQVLGFFIVFMYGFTGNRECHMY